MQEPALDYELASVIAAAVAMLSEQHTTRYIVRNITRISDPTPIWSAAGRAALMESRRRVGGRS